MDRKIYFLALCAVIFTFFISCVYSKPHSHADGHKNSDGDEHKDENNEALPNNSTKKPSRYSRPSKRQLGLSEIPPPPVLPKMPPLPNFNLPHEEFKAQLAVYMEKFNEGLQMVMDGFHEFVHDSLSGLLGGLDHSTHFITAADPDMFKEMLAKDDEKNAAKRRKLTKTIKERNKVIPVKASSNSSVTTEKKS